MQPRPMAETFRSLRPSSRVCIRCSFRLRGVLWRGGKHFADDAQRGAGGRPARIEGEMRDRFDDLIAGHTVLERLPEVELELVAPIESDQTGDGDEAAVAGAQSGAPPNVIEQDSVADLCEARGDVAPGCAHRGLPVHHRVIPFRGEPHLAFPRLYD